LHAKPTGVAKPYIPKDDANTPAVVVDQAVLKAGESAAQAEARARRARTQRAQNATTIPGHVRVAARQVGAAQEVERISELPGLKPSRTPLVVVASLLAAGAIVAVYFNLRAPSTAIAPTLETAHPSAVVVAPAPPSAASAEVSPPALAESAAPASSGVTEEATEEPDASAQGKSGSGKAASPHRTTTAPTTKPAAHKPPAKRTAPLAPAPNAPLTPAAPAKSKVIVRDTPF
jgi:DnaK suppressor protein